MTMPIGFLYEWVLPCVLGVSIGRVIRYCIESDLARWKKAVIISVAIGATLSFIFFGPQ